MLFELATSQEVALELGRRLRARRLSLNQSQQETAARAGVSPGALRNLERTGLVTVEVLLRVASTLGLLDQLESVFIVQPVSIEQMEAASHSRRRASRRPVDKAL
jgi:transcriptional regulator with XRE-family HTH domain